MKTLIVLLSIALTLALVGCGDYDKVQKRQFWVYVPCPQISGPVIESITSDLVNQQAYSSIVGLLAPGTYVSNDGRGCTFTVNVNGTVVW